MPKTERSLMKWFKAHIADDGKPYLLDKKQARVILDAHKNTLVTARAGSGKTRTIVAKIAYLIAAVGVSSEEIIVFAFNRKARTEINERLTKIAFDGVPLFEQIPKIATTFHAFAYQMLGGKETLGNRLLTAEREEKLTLDLAPEAKQFITRAEQKFFADYNVLKQKIDYLTNAENIMKLKRYYQAMVEYHQRLAKANLLNFNQMMVLSARELKTHPLPYKYIFVDEYQDFSLLFLEQIRALRQACPKAKLLAVGDDWQAINRFAGSDVEYFTHFEKYFPEDCQKLFIPNNYRSSKRIVKNANFFMSTALKDFCGCKVGNKKLKGKIFVQDINSSASDQDTQMPLLLKNYFAIVKQIILENPGKSIKILHRNNEMSFRGWTLEKFCTELLRDFKDPILTKRISYSTIHRSKGLEADIVILLEIDGGKFPGKDKTSGLFEVFGDTAQTLFEDEAKLFYVALTRPKEQLYILSKTTRYTKETRKLNFLSYLNDEWLELLPAL